MDGESKFNFSQGYLEMIGKIMESLHEARLKKKWRNYFELLESYYIALSPRIIRSKKCKIIHEKKIKLEELHNKCYAVWKKHYKTICQAEMTKNGKIDTQLIQDMKEWEILLLETADLLGMLMANNDDAALAISGSNQ